MGLGQGPWANETLSRGRIIHGMAPESKPNERPKHLDLKKDKGLTIVWGDGSESFYPIKYLRRMSPSADARQLREEIAQNPLTVLPSSAVSSSDEALTATGAELVGNYAMRILFSDGHHTGIYSWEYLREIDPGEEEDTPHALS